MRQTSLILGGLWVGVLVGGVISVAHAEIVERVVAVVNSHILLQSELDNRLQPIIPQLQQQISDTNMRQQRLEEIRRQMLNMMIDEELIKQEAQKLKITVSERDLDLAIQDVMRKNNLTLAQLEEALRQEGKSLEDYKETMLKPQLLRLRVINIQVRSRINISDEEIRAYYQKNLRALGADARIHARHIVLAIPPDAKAPQVAERKLFALELIEKIKKGQDFAKLAKLYSHDATTREDGGDLGYFSRGGTLPPNVEDIVFKLKKGEISSPISTEKGFYIVQILDRKESSARTFDEVKDELREQIYGQKMEKATTAWLAEVRKRSYLDIKQ